MSVVMPANQPSNPGGGGQPVAANTFQIALDNVDEGATLSSDLGEVTYAIVDADSTGTVAPVPLNQDYDGDADGVTVTASGTGGKQSKVKYTYTVKDPVKEFKLYVTPATGKKGTIRSDDAGTMTEVTSVTAGEGQNFVCRNVNPGAFWRVEFTDAGGVTPGGQTGTDPAPADDAALVQFYDKQGNCVTSSSRLGADRMR